jgi:hypothetical protein
MLLGENLMKHLSLIAIMISFWIFCVAFCGIVIALDQDEARVSVAWRNDTYYRGSNSLVTVFFISDSLEELKIEYFGLHFDWMESDSFVGFDLSDDPVVIPALEARYFSSISIQIPEDASIGAHNYFVGVNGIQGESTSFSWNSSTLTLIVEGSGQEVYGELVTKTFNDISEAVDSDYQSSEAQSLLEQAENSYSQALSYANQENWNEAVSALESAYSYIEQADAKEQDYKESNNEQIALLFFIGITVVVVAVLIVIFLLKKRKQSPIEKSTN